MIVGGRVSVKIVIRRGPNVNDEIVYKERRKVPKERFLYLFTFVRAVTWAIRLCGPFTVPAERISHRSVTLCMRTLCDLAPDICSTVLVRSVVRRFQCTLTLLQYGSIALVVVVLHRCPS